MEKCKYYQEEHPTLSTIGSESFEIEMIPVCLKQGLRELGASSDVVFCNGDVQKCFFNELSQEALISESGKK